MAASTISGIVQIIMALSTLGFGLVVTTISGFSLHDYFEGEEETIAEMRVFLENGVKAQAILGEDYHEMEASLIGIPLESASSSYSYVVDGDTFVGKFSTSSPEEVTSDTIEIMYLPLNPGVSEVDVQSKYDKAVERSNSSLFLWIGILAAVIGPFSLYRGYKGIRSGIRTWKGS